ncbi:MAG: phage minor head protein [Comamonadaceae bacterium]|nr:phage minor head protein [Comamonadaceae bacterium]
MSDDNRSARTVDARIDNARLAFEEAIAAFAQRLRLAGTERWDDLRSEEHYRAFAVAGAMKADLLADLRAAVQRVIESGVSIDAFRKDFWAAVHQHGWHGWTGEDSEGGRAWRTRVIYTTNLRKSYAAGRWAQMTEPEFAAQYPYWEWVHSGLASEPRPQHLAWSGMTLHHSDPFWRSHYPPRIPPDWGCTCRVRPVAAPAQGAPTQPPQGWQKDAQIGAGAPPQYIGEAIRFMVEQKAQKLPLPEGRALREAIAAYQAAREAQTTASVAALQQFAQTAQETKGRKIVMHVGPLSSAPRIEQATTTPDKPGLDLSGYTISLDNSGVHHAFKMHGNSKTEANRGQIAVDIPDFGVLEQVVNHPDAIKPDGKNISGRDVLLFTKLIDGVGYLIAMEVLAGKRQLMLNSIRKKRGAWRIQEASEQ